MVSVLERREEGRRGLEEFTQLYSRLDTVLRRPPQPSLAKQSADLGPFLHEIRNNHGASDSNFLGV